MYYQPVIGLEVHVELKTKSKMFCTCSAIYFGQKPNTQTCPVCLGLPGALPVPNKQAIEWCMLIGMSLHCEIPFLAKFDRKNYFYPDLAKGYQISQYDEPFCQSGYMVLSSGKRIGIRRAHMEEDTGKLLHETVDGKKVSLIDFNRSGVPLVEIVTEPHFANAVEVKEYLQKLQQIVRYLAVANADMEKGEMRLEPNISLRKMGETELPGYKVEVKNINSFSFVEKAITFEIARQAKLLDTDTLPAQETRGWDEDQKLTVSQRNKEEAADYRYFPEPDIPPFVWEKTYVEQVRKQLPELPEAKQKRFIATYNLPGYNAEILTRERTVADYFEEAVGIGKTHAIEAKKIANWMINKKIDTETVLPASLIKEIKAVEIVDELPEETLKKIVNNVIDSHGKVVTDYRNGKENALMFLVGQVMKEVKGKAKAETVREALINLLK